MMMMTTLVHASPWNVYWINISVVVTEDILCLLEYSFVLIFFFLYFHNPHSKKLA